MIVTEVLNSKMKNLPVAAQTEVLHFVEFLSQKYEQQESENNQWSKFSLDQAMKGLEDETTYSEEDLQENGVRQSRTNRSFQISADGFSSRKFAPSVLVAPIPSGYDDWLVCMISTQIHQAIPNFDEIINTTDSDFAQTRLKSESVIRLSRLAVVSETIFAR